VAEDLPAELDRRLDDLRMMIADVAVESRAGADAALAHDVHDAPDADPVAVIALRPSAHRGHRRLRRVGAAGNAEGQREVGFGLEIFNGLMLAVLEKVEVVFGEVGDQRAMLVLNVEE